MKYFVAISILLLSLLLISACNPPKPKGKLKECDPTKMTSPKIMYWDNPFDENWGNRSQVRIIVQFDKAKRLENFINFFEPDQRAYVADVYRVDSWEWDQKEKKFIVKATKPDSKSPKHEFSLTLVQAVYVQMLSGVFSQAIATNIEYSPNCKECRGVSGKEYSFNLAEFIEILKCYKVVYNKANEKEKDFLKKALLRGIGERIKLYGEPKDDKSKKEKATLEKIKSSLEDSGKILIPE